jgi:hypothetical protein
LYFSLFQECLEHLFPERVSNASLRGPVRGRTKVSKSRFKATGKFYRLQGDNVSLTGLPFQANPTGEIHGA